MSENAGLPVYRFTQEAYDQLVLVAKETPEIYLDPTVDFRVVLESRGVSRAIEETGVEVEQWKELRVVGSGRPNESDIQALEFYRSFRGMTPALATDERIWAWCTHFRYHSYSLQRWRIAKNTNHANYVLGHWFVRKPPEGLWLYNTASRTWWIAHVAEKAAKASGGAFTAEEALADFATFAVHYHIVMAKYDFARHPLVLAEIVRALLNEAKGIKAERGLYAIMKRLNLTSGIHLLDVLPREAIRGKVVEFADEIMSDPEMVADRTRLRNRTPFVSLNVGAGVQSTVLALMADRGEYGLPKPDLAIFADTGWEPPEVYKHLEWLKEELSFEIVTVASGNIRDNLLKGVRPNGKRYLGIPAHLKNPDGSLAVARRQCTDDYKIRPIQEWLRNRLKLQPGRRAPKDVQVEMWLGISVDEATRQKPSRDEWITRRYPLIERGFTRYQLLSWFMKNYPGRQLPRSSCVGCPYRSDVEWKWLRDTDPEAFDEAMLVDGAMRNDPTVRDSITASGGEAFLHKSRIPLQDVNFDDARDYDDLMTEECDGLCGI